MTILNWLLCSDSVSLSNALRQLWGRCTPCQQEVMTNLFPLQNKVVAPNIRMNTNSSRSAKSIVKPRNHVIKIRSFGIDSRSSWHSAMSTSFALRFNVTNLLCTICLNSKATHSKSCRKRSHLCDSRYPLYTNIFSLGNQALTSSRNRLA